MLKGAWKFSKPLLIGLLAKVKKLTATNSFRPCLSLKGEEPEMGRQKACPEPAVSHWRAHGY